MTVIEIVDRSRSLLNEELAATRTFPDDTSSFWKDTTLLGFLNTTQQEVAMEIVQTFEDYFVTEATLNISNNQAEYALPTNFFKMRRVEDIRNSPIEIVPIGINEKSDVHYPFNNNSSSLFGGSYYLKGNSIVFDNTPTFTTNSAVKLYYVKVLSDLTAASQTAEIPPEHHRVLVWGIVKQALFQQQSPSEYATAEYEKHLGRLKIYAETRQVQRTRYVKRRRK